MSAVGAPEHAHRLGQFECAHDARAASAGPQHGSPVESTTDTPATYGRSTADNGSTRSRHGRSGGVSGGSHVWDLPGRTPGLAGQDRLPSVQSAHVDADGHAASRDAERHGFALVVDGISVGSDAELHSSPSVGEGALVFVGKVLVACDAPASA